MSYMVHPPETFSTERVTGRKPRIEDAVAIFETYATDPDITRYLVFEPYSQLEDLESWLAQTILEWEDHPGVMYVLFDRENPNQILGSFSIRMEGFRAEIGYLVAKPYWGKGYMTEVMQHWVDWALEQPGLFRVGALCDVDNPASARVMEKVGMEREGILRRYSVHPNLGPEPRDVFCYAKTR